MKFGFQQDIFQVEDQFKRYFKEVIGVFRLLELLGIHLKVFNF